MLGSLFTDAYQDLTESEGEQKKRQSKAKAPLSLQVVSVST